MDDEVRELGFFGTADGFLDKFPLSLLPYLHPKQVQRERERETDHPGIGDGAEIRVDDLADIPCKGLACLS